MLSVVVALVLLCAVQCGPAKKVTPQRQLHLMRGCDGEEVLSDLEYSISSLDNFLSTNHIEVGSTGTATSCGYILSDGAMADTIWGALTNVELLERCRGFFHLDDSLKETTR
jgi:hypothetical protein